MILVTGSILAREETFDDVLRSCLEHVERSRKEPGCISHDVHVDCQNPMVHGKPLRWMLESRSDFIGMGR
ncbi:putative quinol monooxygenase [Bradyrhizobium sp. AZCC 1693]|uniref:putative quinol monooxygenase n=1 Tax=Bradyrhizobium sp. AZCC 1693 TaxID=3117029 RepID=UPI002FF0FE48